MRLLKEQGINVKVTLQPHPYPKGGVQGEKGVNKSFILYDCTTKEVLEFFLNRLDDAGATEEDTE